MLADTEERVFHLQEVAYEKIVQYIHFERRLEVAKHAARVAGKGFGLGETDNTFCNNMNTKRSEIYNFIIF